VLGTSFFNSVLNSFLIIYRISILPKLPGRNLLVLQPQRKQAETFSMSDLNFQNIRPSTDLEGGYSVVFGIRNRSWICYSRYNLFGITGIRVRVAAYRSTHVEVRLDGSKGVVVGSVDISPTAANGTLRTFSSFEGRIFQQQLQLDPSNLCLVFLSSEGRGVLADLNWFELLGPGATVAPDQPVPFGSPVSSPLRQGSPLQEPKVSKANPSVPPTTPFVAATLAAILSSALMA
jgi:hypothetical protein